MKHPKILAFMQNAWFPPGTERGIIERYQTDQEFHRRLLAMTMSGGRLLSAFGHDMYNQIWWDNVSPTHTETPSGLSAADMQHVELTIKTYQPDVIITFGKSAEEALDQSIMAMDIDYMCCHHPNARHKTSADLADFAIQVAEWCDTWRIKNHDDI